MPQSTRCWLKISSQRKKLLNNLVNLNHRHPRSVDIHGNAVGIPNMLVRRCSISTADRQTDRQTAVTSAVVRLCIISQQLSVYHQSAVQIPSTTIAMGVILKIRIRDNRRGSSLMAVRANDEGCTLVDSSRLLFQRIRGTVMLSTRKVFVH